MNYRNITISLIMITIFSSCQFNQSVNKDLITGAYSRGDGIGINDIKVTVNGEAVKSNNFVFGEKVNIIFNRVSGLTNFEGKTFPKLSMYIVKNKKDTVLSNPNLLKNLSDGTDLKPLQLQASFRTMLPNHNKEKYILFIEITDKKGKGKFNYELPFTIKENDLLNIKSEGIDYSTIYLWNETLKQPVYSNQVNSKDIFILILNDVQGLEVIDNKVFPIFSLDLVDNNGNKIISNPNLLSAYEEVGVNPQDLKSQVTAKITFNKGKVNNPLRLNVKLKDKNSSKEINISTKLTVN